MLYSVFLFNGLQDGIIRKRFFGSAGKSDGVSSFRGDLQSFEVLDVVALKFVVVLVVDVENSLGPAQHQDIINSNQELISSFPSFLYATKEGMKKLYPFSDFDANRHFFWFRHYLLQFKCRTIR